MITNLYKIFTERSLIAPFLLSIIILRRMIMNTFDELRDEWIRSGTYMELVEYVHSRYYPLYNDEDGSILGFVRRAEDEIYYK